MKIFEKKMNPILHNAKPAALADSNHELIQEFKSMTALALYLKADRVRLAKFKISRELFRGPPRGGRTGLYYIKPVSLKSKLLKIQTKTNPLCHLIIIRLILLILILGLKEVTFIRDYLNIKFPGATLY